MAQTILGLDIGSYSVKVATLQASFRSLNLTSVEEYIIPHAGRARPERSAAEVLERVAVRAKEKDAVQSRRGGRSQAQHPTQRRRQWWR